MKIGRQLDDDRKMTRNRMGTEDGLACGGAVQDRPPGSKASKAASFVPICLPTFDWADIELLVFDRPFVADFSFTGPRGGHKTSPAPTFPWSLG